MIERFLVPVLAPGATLGEVLRRFCAVRGNATARAAVENALLDLSAKRARLPLRQVLGLPLRRIPSGISVGLQGSVDVLLDAGGLIDLPRGDGIGVSVLADRLERFTIGRVWLV